VNVIPNEPAEVGLDIFGVANLGTNIFLPNYEMLRRYEFTDNFTITAGTIRSGWAGRVESRQSHANECLSAGPL